MTIPTLTRTAGSAGPQLYWMGDGAEQFEVERDELVTDIEGEHLSTLIGVSDPFQYTSREWGEKTGIRLLFEVAKDERKGERYSLMFGYSIGKKANLTQVVEALQRAPITDGQEINLGSLLGEHCYIFTIVSESNKDGTIYQNTNFKGARAYTPKPKAAQPVKKAAPAPIEDDPFDTEE